MTELNFAPTSQESLAAAAEVDGDALVLSLSGTADQRQTHFLDGVLDNIHSEALRLGVSEVAVDMRDLEFMNSTAFKSLLTWITSIVALGEDKQYGVRFISTAQHHWQRRSLDALRCFAVNLISIDT